MGASMRCPDGWLSPLRLARSEKRCPDGLWRNRRGFSSGGTRACALSGTLSPNFRHNSGTRTRALAHMSGLAALYQQRLPSARIVGQSPCPTSQTRWVRARRNGRPWSLPYVHLGKLVYSGRPERRYLRGGCQYPHCFQALGSGAWHTVSNNVCLFGQRVSLQRCSPSNTNARQDFSGRATTGHTSCE